MPADTTSNCCAWVSPGISALNCVGTAFTLGTPRRGKITLAIAGASPVTSPFSSMYPNGTSPATPILTSPASRSRSSRSPPSTFPSSGTRLQAAVPNTPSAAAPAP